jgi:hypothetical protein
MELSTQNPGIDYHSIVESLRMELLARTEDELQRQKSRIGREHQLAGAAPGSAYVQAILRAECDHKQRLLDHLMESIGTAFPGVLLDHFKDALFHVIEEEYAKIPLAMDKPAIRTRGYQPASYTGQILKQKETATRIVEAKCSVSRGGVPVGKRAIFISHAQEDAPLAEVVKVQIEKVFGKGVAVFVSSIPGAIPPGSDWLDSILRNLVSSDAFFVLLTPNSMQRRFVWFEIGFSWLRRQQKECEMYAACVPPIVVGSLPEPLCRLQATALSDKGRTQALFARLIKQYGLGNLDTLEFDRISAAIPSYPAQADKQGSSADSSTSRYSGYSDEAMKQVLFDVLSREKKRHLDPVTRSPIFLGELIDFAAFDQEHGLPIGTSRRFLKHVGAQRDFQLEVEWEDEKAIRFDRKFEFWT